jgi:16S rRNA C967 or C1407 C5-methylase (RsmB/RsmF family)
MAREKVRLAREKARKEGHEATREGKKSGEIKKKKRRRGNTSMGLTGSEIVDGSDEEGPPVSVLPASLESSETVEFFEQGPARGVSSGKKGNKQRKLMKNEQNEGRAEDNKKRMQMLLWKRFNGRNNCFEEYYKRQNLASPKEWTSLLQKLGEPLPVTFRLNECHPDKDATADRLQADFNLRPGEAIKSNGKRVEYMVKPIECIKGVSAWQCSVDRSGLRHSTGSLKGLHEFVVNGSNTGILVRQELVSMVPVHLLDVEPHHMVLDLCAAPGSKTSQLQEIMAGVGSTGLIVANDNDQTRAQTLLGAVKRGQAQGMTVPVAVTCHEGGVFPSALSGERKKGKSQQKSSGGFDRVLVDAPCSGDGTLRKYPELLRKWSTSAGMQQHRTQLRLVQRGAQLLKVGGVLVYSTNSLNPIENEGVVASLLQWSGGALELVQTECKLKAEADAEAAATAAVAAAEAPKQKEDARKREGKEGQTKGQKLAVIKTNKKKNKKERRKQRQQEEQQRLQEEEEEEEEEEENSTGRGGKGSSRAGAPDPHPLSDMVYRPGLVSWSVAVDNGSEGEAGEQLQWFDSYDAAKKAGIKGIISKTMWPPSVKTQEGMHLDRCLRFLPTDNDSSGSFCAKLRLAKPLAGNAKTNAGSAGEAPKKRRARGYEQIPVELWEELKEMFGIDLDMGDMTDDRMAGEMAGAPENKKLEREQCWLRKAGGSRDAAAHTSVVIGSPMLG